MMLVRNSLRSKLCLFVFLWTDRMNLAQYVLGSLGVFQDIPLSLQILVKAEFFQLSTETKFDADLFDEEELNNEILENLKRVTAANELLLWLSGGENALNSSRNTEHTHKLKQTENNNTPNIPQTSTTESHNIETENVIIDDYDGGGVDPIAKDIVDKIFTRNQTLDLTDENQFNDGVLVQPSIMNGCVEMKR